jgi:unsaturated pyranuronate lyase
MLQHIRWSDHEMEQLNPLLARQLAVGENVMVARIVLKKGCVVPMHHHHNEQISCMLEGALRFELGGENIVVRAGEVLAIPPNLPHLAEALEDSVALDVFSPPREDWINKTDDYLRK